MTRTKAEALDSDEHIIVRWRNRRPVSRTMSDAEAWEMIEARNLGRLGCVDGGEPYVVPFNYFCENGFIYGHSLPGKKIKALRAHSRSCVQIDEVQDDFHWRSVIAFGDFQEIRDEAERQQAMRKLLNNFPQLTPVDSFVRLDAVTSEVVVFRICIDRVTGVAKA